MPADGNPWVEHLLGWRFEFHLDPLRVVGEGPLRAGWRLGVVLLPFERALRVAEVKIFPDGDRRRVKSQREALGTNVHLGMWSLDPSALDPETPSITGEMLRSIRLSEIVRAVQDQWSSDLGRTDRTQWEALLGAKPSAIASEFVQSVDVEHRPVGRPKQNKAARRDVELATIASHYADAVRGGSTSPIRYVTEKLGLDPNDAKDRRYVRDAKFQAVEKGYLDGTQPRRAAGTLSRRAIELLEATAKETKS